MLAAPLATTVPFLRAYTPGGVFLVLRQLSGESRPPLWKRVAGTQSPLTHHMFWDIEVPGSLAIALALSRGHARGSVATTTFFPP